MGVEFFPAFVGFIQRIEKRHRVRDMHHHRQFEFTCRRPDRIKPGIINRHQLIVMIAHMQPERFPDFQPLRAAPGLNTQPFRRPFAKLIAVLGPGVPVHAAEDDENAPAQPP